MTSLLNLRSLALGGADAAGVGTTYWAALSLAWYGGILAVFNAIAGARFARPGQRTDLVTPRQRRHREPA